MKTSCNLTLWSRPHLLQVFCLLHFLFHLIYSEPSVLLAFVTCTLETGAELEGRAAGSFVTTGLGGLQLVG